MAIDPMLMASMGNMFLQGMGGLFSGTPGDEMRRRQMFDAVIRQLYDPSYVPENIRGAGTAAIQSYRTNPLVEAARRSLNMGQTAYNKIMAAMPQNPFARPDTGFAGIDYFQPRFVQAQAGYNGMVNQPTLFMAGEAGPEYVNVNPNIAPGGQYLYGNTQQDVINAAQQNQMFPNQYSGSTGDYRDTLRGGQPSGMGGAMPGTATGGYYSGQDISGSANAPGGGTGETPYGPVPPGSAAPGTGMFTGNETPPANTQAAYTQVNQPPPMGDISYNMFSGGDPEYNAMMRSLAMQGMQGAGNYQDIYNTLGNQMIGLINENAAARGAFGGSANQANIARGLGGLGLDIMNQANAARNQALLSALGVGQGLYGQDVTRFGLNQGAQQQAYNQAADIFRTNADLYFRNLAAQQGMEDRAYNYQMAPYYAMMQQQQMNPWTMYAGGGSV